MKDKFFRKCEIVETNFAKLMPFVHFHPNNNLNSKRFDARYSIDERLNRMTIVTKDLPWTVCRMYFSFENSCILPSFHFVWISKLQISILNTTLEWMFVTCTKIWSIHWCLWSVQRAAFISAIFVCVESKVVQRNHTQYSNMCFVFVLILHSFHACILYIEIRFCFHNNCRRFLEISMWFFSLCSVKFQRLNVCYNFSIFAYE